MFLLHLANTSSPAHQNHPRYFFPALSGRISFDFLKCTKSESIFLLYLRFLENLRQLVGWQLLSTNVEEYPVYLFSYIVSKFPYLDFPVLATMLGIARASLALQYVTIRVACPFLPQFYCLALSHYFVRYTSNYFESCYPILRLSSNLVTMQCLSVNIFWLILFQALRNSRSCYSA